MNSKKIIVLLLILLVCQENLSAQNRLDSRVFYERPKLYSSPTHLEFFKTKLFTVLAPLDNRADFYGEIAYKNKNVQHYNDFWEKPVTIEIQEKIVRDLDQLTSINPLQIKSDTNITIYTIIEVFYPDVRGFIWAKSFAKVRISFKVLTENNFVLLDKKYESLYVSAGTDSEWEGSKFETIENGANITIGIALRKVLDLFYSDLNNKL